MMSLALADTGGRALADRAPDRRRWSAPAVGLVNGFGLTLLHLPHPFIMTLGTLNIARGLTNLVSDGVPICGSQTQVRFLGIANITAALRRQVRRHPGQRHRAARLLCRRRPGS